MILSWVRPDATHDLERAGFLQRLLAILLDLLIVPTPLFFLIAYLFTATNGLVQSDAPISICSKTNGAPSVLTSTSSPSVASFTTVCHYSFFGLPTGARMTVARVARAGEANEISSEKYMLDKDDKPIEGYSVTWIVDTALLIYLAVTLTGSGRTLGCRVFGIRVVDIKQPSVSGVALRKLVLRYLILASALAPLFSLLIYSAVARPSPTQELSNWVIFAGRFAFLFYGVCIVQIALGWTPVYDKLAGTAVIKD